MTGRTWPPAADRGLARKRPVNAPFHRCHDRFLIAHRRPQPRPTPPRHPARLSGDLEGLQRGYQPSDGASCCLPTFGAAISFPASVEMKARACSCCAGSTIPGEYFTMAASTSLGCCRCCVIDSMTAAFSTVGQCTLEASPPAFWIASKACCANVQDAPAVRRSTRTRSSTRRCRSWSSFSRSAAFSRSALMALTRS